MVIGIGGGWERVSCFDRWEVIEVDWILALKLCM